MTQNTWNESNTGDRSPNGGDACPDPGGQGAAGFAGEAMDAAVGAGSQAREMASDRAEQVKGAAAGHLRAFAGAVRAAGDELAENEPGQVSQLVSKAAEGLEQFSKTLETRSSGEMFDSVRTFGRENPVVFLAGAMLAGFALARLASSPATEQDDEDADQSPDDRHEARATAGASPTGAWPIGQKGAGPNRPQSVGGPAVGAAAPDAKRPDDASVETTSRSNA